MNKAMKKPMIIMLVSLGILFGAIFGFKAFEGFMFHRFLASQKQIIVVSAMQVPYTLWQPHVEEVGSLRAVLGVNVTTEAPGMVRNIFFTPGQMVAKNAILVQLDTDPDVAQLHVLQANAELAKVTYTRDQAQFAVQAVSKETVDTDFANVKSTEASVNQQIAIISEKVIRAPFAGRLGICQINPGQYLTPGNAITSLQTLDPIYADFYVPQSQLAQIQVGQAVTLTTESHPGEVFSGKITTIDSALDTSTRNVEIEATIDNPKAELIPGMFAPVKVTSGAPQRFLTLPQAAISFNPYGDLVYLLKPSKQKDKDGKAIFTAEQTFVTTGATRNDQIAILKGLNEGDTVVTSGQLKLKNGSLVIINNTVVPKNNPIPTPDERVDE